MELEDERSALLRDNHLQKTKESFLNEELEKLKVEQSKLAEDIQEFISLRDQFD